MKTASSNGDLPPKVQMKMENAFGQDFSNVNIHKDSKSATDVGALAYAQGNDVHFAPGQFKPNTQAGQELIGHELTHVVQQREGRVKPTTQAKGLPVNDDKGLEKEADDMGKMAAQGKFEETQYPNINEQNTLIQVKGHEKGCCCPGCSGTTQLSLKTPINNQIFQKKTVAQLRPANVVDHTFLGISVVGGVTRNLQTRLNNVQTELQSQYDALPDNNEKPANLQTYAGLNTIKGWQNRQGNHGTGNAVDVNYMNQPYIPTRTENNGRTVYGGEGSTRADPNIRALRQPATEVYDRAANFVRTDSTAAENADVNNRRHGETATMVYRRFKHASDSLKTYFSLAFNTNFDTVRRRPIRNPETASESDLLSEIPTTERKEEGIAIREITEFMNQPDWITLHPNTNLPARSQYFRILKDYEIVRKPMQRGAPSVRPNNTRNPALGFLHMPEHFVVAMMEQGNLSWGACEFSNGANGDIHHFDTGANRNHRLSPALPPEVPTPEPENTRTEVPTKDIPEEKNLKTSTQKGTVLFAKITDDKKGIQITYKGKTSIILANKKGLIRMPDGKGNFEGVTDFNLADILTNYSSNDVEKKEGDHFLNLKSAVGMLNAIGNFAQKYEDASIAMGDGSTRTGNSPRIFNTKPGAKRHATHYDGTAYDGRYLNAKGKSKKGGKIVDTNANYDFFKNHIEQGFNFIIIGSHKRFTALKDKLNKLKSIHKKLVAKQAKDHNDHFHIAIKKVSKKSSNFYKENAQKK